MYRGDMSDGEYAVGNYLAGRLVEAEVDRRYRKASLALPARLTLPGSGE
jgi:hypothetical protein